VVEEHVGQFDVGMDNMMAVVEVMYNVTNTVGKDKISRPILILMYQACQDRA